MHASTRRQLSFTNLSWAPNARLDNTGKKARQRWREAKREKAKGQSGYIRTALMKQQQQQQTSPKTNQLPRQSPLFDPPVELTVRLFLETLGMTFLAFAKGQGLRKAAMRHTPTCGRCLRSILEHMYPEFTAIKTIFHTRAPKRARRPYKRSRGVHTPCYQIPPNVSSTRPKPRT